MSTRWLKGRGPDLRVAHEVLSLTTLVAIAVHGVVLLGDAFLHPSLADIRSRSRAATRRCGPRSASSAAGRWPSSGSPTTRGAHRRRRWRALHRFTALAWVLGVAHSLGEGTDAGQVWFLAMTAVVAVPAALLLVGRLTAAPRPA